MSEVNETNSKPSSQTPDKKLKKNWILKALHSLSKKSSREKWRFALGGLGGALIFCYSVNIISIEDTISKGYLRITSDKEQIYFDSLYTWRATQKYTIGRGLVLFKEVVRDENDWFWKLLDKNGKIKDTARAQRTYDISKLAPGDYTLELFTVHVSNSDYENKTRVEFEVLSRRPKADFTIDKKKSKVVAVPFGVDVPLRASMKYDSFYVWDFGQSFKEVPNRLEIVLKKDSLEPGNYPIYLKVYNGKNEVTTVRKVLKVLQPGEIPLIEEIDTEEILVEEAVEFYRDIRKSEEQIKRSLTSLFKDLSKKQSIAQTNILEQKIIRLLGNNDVTIEGPDMPLSAFLINLKMTATNEGKNFEFSDFKWALDSTVVKFTLIENLWK